MNLTINLYLKGKFVIHLRDSLQTLQFKNEFFLWYTEYYKGKTKNPNFRCNVGQCTPNAMKYAKQILEPALIKFENEYKE